MQSIRRISLVALAMVSSLTSVSAFAQTGFEIMVRPGFGSAGSDSPVRYEPSGVVRMDPSAVGSIWGGTAKPYGGGMVVDGSIGYRPLRMLSFGLAGGYRQSSASATPDALSNLSRSAIQVGFYGRGYLPLAGALTGLDPWASIGVNYV